MKKFFLIILIVFTASFKTIAQEGVHIGLKGGLNLSNMNSDDFADSSLRAGLHLGVLAEIPIGTTFSIQPEILYSTHGTEADVTLLGGNPMDIGYHLDYIQVPILAKIYLASSLSIELGPSLNVLVNENIGGEKTDIGKSLEFGGGLGVTYAFSSSFFAGIRYIHGFTDALDQDNGSIRNNGLQIGVGYLLK